MIIIFNHITKKEILAIINKDSKYEINNIYLSDGINNLLDECPHLLDEIFYCLFCQSHFIWDDTPAQIKRENMEALATELEPCIDTRFLTSQGMIYIREFISVPTTVSVMLWYEV